MLRISLAMVAAGTVGILAAGLSAAEPGRVTQWLLAGPFESDKPAELLAQETLGDPDALAPTEGTAIGQRKWIKFTTPTGYINPLDKGAGVGSPKPAGVTAFVYVHSPKAQPAKVLMGFSDGLAVYLNGRKVFQKDDGGGGSADAFRADVLLGEGWNRLYVKSIWHAHFRGSWSFGVRLADDDLNPLDGLKFSLDNPYPEGKPVPPAYKPFVNAFTVEHFGIHRLRLVNRGPTDLAGASLTVTGKAGQKLMEKKLGALKGYAEVEVDIDTDEVSFQQNWPGAVATVAFEGGQVQAPLARLALEEAVTVEYQTPHIQRMKPWAAGRVKILLLVSGSNRQTIELVQRGDFEWHLVDTSIDLTETDKTLRQEQEKRLLAELGKRIGEELANNKFDCIVASSQSWKKLPAVAELTSAVEKGTGLVAVTPLDLPESVDKLLGLAPSAGAASQPGRAGKVEKGADHAVTAGVPLEALPAMAPAPIKAAEGAVVAAKVGEVPCVVAQDKQTFRTVALNFGRGSSLIWPIPRDQFLDNYRLPVWERQWSLVLKSILWATKKPTHFALTAALPAKVSREALSGTKLRVTIAGPSGDVRPTGLSRLELRFRSRGLGGVDVASKEFAKQGGTQEFEFPLPEALEGGENEVDVVLKTKAGNAGDLVDSWASAVFVVEPRGSIGKITVEPAGKDYFLPADEITFTVPGKADADGLTLVARILDNHGRCVAQKQAEVKKGDFKEKFAFKPEGLLTTVGRFQAELTAKDVSEARAEQIFYVRHEFVWDSYEPVLWLTRAGAGWYYDLDYFRLLNDVMWIPNGWGASFGPGGAEQTQMIHGGLEGCGLESLHFFSMNHNWTNATFEMRRNKFAQTKDIHWLYRTPVDKATGLPVDQPDYSNLPFGNDPYNTYFPLDDPGYQEWTKKKIAAQIQGVRRLNPLVYDLMDEGSYTSYARAFDFDFSPGSIQRFRAWLKGQYASLEALNKEWDTAFASWDDVMPMHIQQVREHVKGKKLPSYAPWVDHRKYNDIVYNQYIKLCSDAARAAGDSDAYVGIGGGQRPNPYGGWDYWLVSNYFTWVENYFDDTTEYIRSFNTKDRRLKACPGADVWWSLKNGNSGFYRWVDYGHIRGDFSLLPRGKSTAEQLAEVRGRGLAKLLYKADPIDDPIAIHYSQSTVQVSHAVGGAGSADQFGNGGPLVPKLGFYYLLEELGYQYKFVSYAQVEDGHLQKAGYKLMILPESIALSDAEARQLRAFVEAGGVLLADWKTGQWDDHGRRREKTVMEETFGIAPDAPGEKAIGKGTVVYLGDDFPSRYWSIRPSGDVKTYWDKMGEVLKKAGLDKPRACVLTAQGAPSHRAEIRYFQLGKVRYHVISADIPGKYLFASAADGHLYDMRDGRYAQGKNRIEIDVRPEFPAIVALSPYKIDGVTAAADKPQVQPGDAVKITASVKAADKPDVHALNFRVYAPDGAERRWYGNTLFGENGSATLTVQTALNEAKGKWTVKVADLASNQTGEASFEVK